MKRLFLSFIFIFAAFSAFAAAAGLFQTAGEYLVKGKYEEAVKCYRDFSTANPEHRLAPAALFNAASITQSELKDIDASKAGYTAAAQKYPGTKWAAESYRRLGEIAAEAGDSKTALDYYKLGLQNSRGEDYEMPDYWVRDIARKCGEIGSGITDPQEKLAALREIVEFIPPGDDAAACAYSIVGALNELNRREEAAQSLAETLYEFPISPVSRRITDDDREMVSEYVDFPWETLEQIQSLESIFNRREYSQAKAILLEIQTSEPDGPFKKSIEFGLAFFTVYETGDFETAIERMRELIDKYPDGVVASEARRNIETWARIMEVEDRVAEDPDDLTSSQESGFLLLRSRFYDLAEKRFLKAAENPQFTDAHFGLGYTYLRMGETEKSAVSFEKYLKENPNDTRILNIVGYNYIAMNRMEDALRCFRKYVELEPEHPNSHDSYAECLMNMGRTEEAVAEYQKTLELDPNWSNGLFMLGEIYKIQDDKKKALEYYHRYLKMDPQGRQSGQVRENIHSLEAEKSDN